MRIACISDTHLRHQRLTIPPCDLLVHAGDLTRHGTEVELRAALDWLAVQPATHKLFVAGNHDVVCERQPARVRAMAERAGLVYLCDEACEIEGRRIWGSPITPTFRRMAFNRDRGPPIRRHWDAIPDDLDLLVTHGPPRGVLDRMVLGMHVGCDDLLVRVQQAAPRVHVFGHIHEAHGQTTLPGLRTRFVNAASARLLRRSTRAAVMLEL